MVFCACVQKTVTLPLQHKKITMKFILSDGNSTNTKGYKVLIAGIKMERFIANPMMLSEHCPEKVIGRWENWVKADNKLEAEAVFDVEDVLGKEVSRKVEANFLRCASMGIIPLRLELIDDEFVMTECELVEASVVSIPSDAGAIRLYNEKLEELSFEQVKENLHFNYKQNKMATEILKLSQNTLEKLGLTADCTAKEVELAVMEKDRTIEALKADLAKKDKEQIETYLSAAVKSGKISEAEKPQYLKLSESNFESVKAILDAKSETASASLASLVQTSTLAAGREGWDYLKWMKEDPKGLQKLRLENPSAFENLQLTIKK